MHSTTELFEDVVLPGALETRSQLADDLVEMRDQLRKQVARLQELRIKKVEQPGTLFPSYRFEFDGVSNTGLPRCLLWHRGHESPQRRRDDGCVDGADSVHEVHGRAICHIQGIQVSDIPYSS